ncbi:MAG: hypothetical protein NT007_02415 [Candidatus Kapabacteria bacterium]|nr:hypothetical protein [Candidatus Kapabacteria bacterium]
MITQALAQSTSPGTGITAAAGSNAQVSKDQFLKLLTYQLKSQNPLQPYNNQEFASQLAQFSQLEQLTNIYTLLDSQGKSNQALSQTISNSALPGMLGKTAKAETSSITFNGSSPASIGFNMPIQGANGEIRITDSKGKLVKSIPLGLSELSGGDHNINWDGKNSDGTVVSAGNYNFSVISSDGSGGSINSKSYTYGKIEAIRFKTDGTVLVINGQEVPLANISDVSNN